ncbi:unnamed protein product [Spirodela intermedia]|uniref:Serine/threonine-protein kinase ATM n=1 Tax=Spirodela intermedia TaxID=51605 RepID=A0A7I8KX03_SPIIN|nr:unnamed protein product [Spirodela intermedia]
MATSRDVQEIVSRLSSNKAKIREEGAKLLNSWLVGERSFSFCRLLGQNTSRMRPDDVPHAETWPYLVTLLTKCIALEKNASKKSLPKLIWAKMLRIVVQHAEDPKCSGKTLHLHSVIKLLFNHTWDIINDVPSFQPEYGIILRHLLSVKEYRYQMRKRVYSGLVLLYMKKIGALLMGESKIHSSTKEEAFRCILTLHALLENPPGDFPDNIRADAVKGFVEILSQIREEGKISRKLMACVNTFLLKDGPNLGSQALEIHSSIHDFIFRYWLLTHDRGLKSSFILYAKIQLKLIRKGESGLLIEQLLDVIGKELDLCGVSGGLGESTRDDKVGSTNSQQSLMELSAIVFYQACMNSLKVSGNDKRLKKPDAIDRLRDGLMKGKWLWSGAFCFLIRNYGFCIEEYLLTHLFKGLCESFERILSDSYGTHSYDGILWILRSVFQVRQGWHTVWSSLMHGLPTFSNVPQVDLVSMPIVPQEVWEVQLFKHTPSVCALYFIACYFSKSGVQGNLHDILYLRKCLLKASMQLVNSKESFFLNKQIAMVLPAAIFSLSAGYCPFLPTSMCHMLVEEWSKLICSMKPFQFQDHKEIEGFPEYSVEVLAKINNETVIELPKPENCQSIRLSRDLSGQLIHEMGEYFLAITDFDQEMERKSLSDISLFCLFLSNLIYSLNLTRLRNEKSLLFSKVLSCIIRLLQLIISTVEEKHKELHLRGSLGVASITELSGSALSSLSCLIQCPLFCVLGDGSAVLGEFHENIRQSIEKLLLVITNLLKDFATCTADGDLKGETSQHICLIAGDGMKIVDMELDFDDGPKDVEDLAVNGDSVSGVSFSVLQWKLDMISSISSFFTVLPATTWEVMLNLLENASDAKVAECLIFYICKCFPLSKGSLSPLVISMNKMIDSSASRSICFVNILTAIHSLLRSVSSKNRKNDGHLWQPKRQNVSEQDLALLGALVHRIGDTDVLDWSGRVELIECVCGFILLDPSTGQEMVPRLLALLQDPDYRVRLFLARRIGILFQTWDGHEELLQDICSNFGILLVMASKDKLIKAREVLAAGSQSPMRLETALITLAHIAFHSDKVELKVVFMICAIAAINPGQRDMVYALFDNLSTRLWYSSRTKYFEALLGPLIYIWITCELSLVSLVEVRDLFIVKAEPKAFLQFCCPWLISLLLIRQDLANLNFISSVAGQPLAVLSKKHFVKVFSICIALRSSANADNEAGEFVLSSSILHIAEISEHERDDLIKKHMVSIVSCLLSLTFCGSDPPIPFFSMETIASGIKTVVDGFLEIDDSSTADVIIDKLNVFRPDRVFKFLLEIHYQITSTAHHRHKRHVLSSVEVLMKTIGHKATVSSTSLYIFNLVGQFITDPALQDQCCDILSMLLSAFQISSTKDDVNVLGEQLQFLVSKLVICCTPYETREGPSSPSSKILSLLQQLTVDADKSLYDYIRRIKSFHDELCRANCPRDHFLKVNDPPLLVKKISYLPQTLVVWSLRTLTTNLPTRKGVQLEVNAIGISEELNLWNSDPELVSGVWALLGICGSSDAKEIKSLVSAFISQVGIGDPHRIVFHLPGDTARNETFSKYGGSIVSNESILSDVGFSEEVLISLIRLLKKYFLDDGVTVVDLTSRTLQGILSTEMGQCALSSFNGYDKSLISVHSKGVNSEVVEKLIFDSREKPTEDLSATALWRTHSKSYEMWICSLVHSLICFSDDVILRLCQDIVLLKVELAELLLPSVLVNISGRNDSVVDLCQIISMKVEENIFLESNYAIKSIQIWLNVLNILRSYDNTEMSHSFQRTSKLNLFSFYQKFLFQLVYWLSIDYLVVAKAAIHCGSYFTAVMYVEYWCEENFNCLTLGSPDFSNLESLPPHVELLISAVTQINEPDSLYGIIQTYKVSSQIITYEHEGNWSKALEHYDLLIRKASVGKIGGMSRDYEAVYAQGLNHVSSSREVKETGVWKLHKGLMRSLQQIGCSHLLDVYFQGLTKQNCYFQHDLDFTELQYEAAWRSGNWDFSLLHVDLPPTHSGNDLRNSHFNEKLHSCLRALQDGDCNEFHANLTDAKEELVISICNASKESTGYINSTIVKLQILDHLGRAWDLRWKPHTYKCGESQTVIKKTLSEPVIPTISQLECMNAGWKLILKQTQLHLNLLEPFIAFRHALLQILQCKECTAGHLLESASTLRKGSRFSLAAAAMHEFKLLFAEDEKEPSSYIFPLGRIEEAKILRAQGQHEMAINLAIYILENYQLAEEASNVNRLVGKWLVESRSSSSRTILEKYLKHSVELAELNKNVDEKSISRQCQTYFHLAHYTDALFKSYEARLTSSEWQAALRLRKHKGDKTDYSAKIQELQKQLTMDREEAEKLQDDRDNFLSLALDGYQRCLSIGGKYDMRVVFRLISLWFNFPSRPNVVKSMLRAVNEIQSHKFIPLVYQIASRMGSSKEGKGPVTFQAVLVSLVKKMAIDHPYHTLFQLLALANGDRVKDKQRSRNSFIVDMDKKLAAENLLNELSSYHGPIIRQMKQMVDIYIKLAEVETKKEETNRRIPLPREIRSVRHLELVPVVTATFPVDPSCQYGEGSFPHFKGLGDSIVVMNGINAPKVVECLGSDGCKYRQLAKSGNDDLRQDAVMEQFFGLVNTFLQGNRDTWKRRLKIRTYKVVPFTPSAGVLEWVNQTVPLGEYLIGSSRNGGAHGRYGKGNWSFLHCREHMTNEKDKRKAFHKVCENFRPVMHHFFLERFLLPSDWFEKRLSYTRSVAASSMVGYIVGLGDRHSMNILIDQSSAEVVHIDLGVAFEQGLMLKTPERVPFRLTRDIVDGMGVTGVEGVFRRCCEETLAVMRTNKEALLTIVEVFIHDPLYKWALSPLKALQRQKETDEDAEPSLEDSQDACEGNKDAARALFRVKQKLDGYEDAEMRSVQGQVQQLIQDATDTERLCQMFPDFEMKTNRQGRRQSCLSGPHPHEKKTCSGELIDA